MPLDVELLYEENRKNYPNDLIRFVQSSAGNDSVVRANFTELVGTKLSKAHEQRR